jgi:hypothetical protein
MLPDEAHGLTVGNRTQGATAVQQFLEGFLYVRGDVLALGLKV